MPPRRGGAVSKPVKHYGMWRIRRIDADGKRRSEVHEKRDDAVFRLREHEQEAAEIRRSLRLPTPAARTFREAADCWETKRAVN